ncbi:hypothetical protein [Abyssisolibacter fermentans]|uniref:hypothetical protein n=1 Tax=Abyssisolibacter fermentans TaxID=1766203 RepID=UPI00082E4C89|nr:hypothetical protein [Abyssisolibacter fermentans]
MQNIINEINKRLDSLDFNKLWKGFTRYDYALFDDENVYFNNGEVIPVDNRFWGNTSIEYEDRYIAIWMINGYINIDVLTACIVHEMFHAHQNTCKQKVYSNEYLGLYYPYNLENYKYRYKERLLLVKALIEKDIDIKENLINKFIMTRLKRAKMIDEYINYEKSIETCEGPAEYLCIKALKKLSHEEYEKRVDNMCNVLCELSENIFNTRRMAYYTGVLQCMISEEMNKDVFYAVGESNVCLFDRILKEGYDEVSEDDEDIDYDNSIIEELYDKYIENIKNNINVVLNNKKAKKESGKFSIAGFDPNNRVLYDNMIYHKYFVIILDGNEKRNIKGPVVTYIEGENSEDCNAFIYIEE